MKKIARRISFIVIPIIILTILGTFIFQFLTEYIWMDSLPFQTIFTTIFSTKVGLGVSGFFLFSITAFITFSWVLSSYVNHFQPSRLQNFILVRRTMIWIFIGASLFTGIVVSSLLWF